MEQEFYEIESFNGRRSFLDKANHYQWFFNIARKNSAKENMTPWGLAQLKHPNANPHLPLLSVEFLDELHDSVLYSSVRGGYDVWALPCFIACLGTSLLCRQIIQVIDQDPQPPMVALIEVEDQAVQVS